MKNLITLLFCFLVFKAIGADCPTPIITQNGVNLPASLIVCGVQPTIFKIKTPEIDTTKFNFKWYKDGIFTAGDTFATKRITVDGEYKVEVLSGVGSGSVTCSPNSMSSIVTVSFKAIPNKPTITSNPNPATVCLTTPATSVLLTSSSAGTGGTYIWSSGQTSISFNPPTSAVGTINYTVRTILAGCTSLASDPVPVVVNQPSKPTIT